MRKNSTILLNNISKNEFKTCFKYKVHDLKELRTSGFSGEIVNDFFWIQYYPEHLSPQNILEWKMPTILEGRIYSQGDKVIISYTFDKHGFAKAISCGIIGFMGVMFIKLISELYLQGYNQMPHFFAGVIMSLVICLIPSAIALASLHISSGSKEQLKKVLYEIIELCSK